MKLVSSQTKINVSFGTKGIVWPEQYLSFQTIIIIIYFVRGERDCTISILRYLYSYHKTYETIYFVFHFIITQDKKIAVSMLTKCELVNFEFFPTFLICGPHQRRFFPFVFIQSGSGPRPHRLQASTGTPAIAYEANAVSLDLKAVIYTSLANYLSQS
jgi:hypothetical protein